MKRMFAGLNSERKPKGPIRLKFAIIRKRRSIKEVKFGKIFTRKGSLRFSEMDGLGEAWGESRKLINENREELAITGRKVK